jgi:hypothetical protein
MNAGHERCATYRNRDRHSGPRMHLVSRSPNQEWDVNPKVPGQDCDDERIVTESDGSAWYTPDHYGIFRRLR